MKQIQVSDLKIGDKIFDIEGIIKDQVKPIEFKVVKITENTLLLKMLTKGEEDTYAIEDDGFYKFSGTNQNTLWYIRD